MLKVVTIVGNGVGTQSELLEKLIAALSRKGKKVGVVVHRVLSGRKKDCSGSAQCYSRAGASQVLITWGKEIGIYNKRGGLTPLIRISARYFNAVDVLLAVGYFDPAPRIEVCSGDDPGAPQLLGDPGLIAVVFNRIRPDLPVPTFSLNDVDELAGLLAEART